MSIDLEKIKKMSIIDMGDWSEISGLDPLEWDEIIQALSEAKEIMEKIRSVNNYNSLDEWLSRYFPDTRKEG